MSLVYVYAFTGEPIAAGRIRGHALDVLDLGGLFAAIERRSDAPEASEASLREQHAVVVELGRQVDAILPARFGALVDDAELARIVALRGERLRDALRQVRGCVQMTVRVPLSVQPAPGGSKGRTAGTAYLLERRAAFAPPPSIGAINAAVRGLTSAEASEVSARGQYATVAHLVPGANLAAYRRAIRAVARKEGLEGAMIVSGPWPPFAFAPDLSS